MIVVIAAVAAVTIGVLLLVDDDARRMLPIQRWKQYIPFRSPGPSEEKVAPVDSDANIYAAVDDDGGIADTPEPPDKPSLHEDAKSSDSTDDVDSNPTTSRPTFADFSPSTTPSSSSRSGGHRPRQRSESPTGFDHTRDTTTPMPRHDASRPADNSLPDERILVEPSGTLRYVNNGGYSHTVENAGSGALLYEGLSHLIQLTECENVYLSQHPSNYDTHSIEVVRTLTDIEVVELRGRPR